MIVTISILLTGNVLSTPTSVTQVFITDKWSSNWRPYGGYVDNLNFVVFAGGERSLAMLALQRGDVDAYDEHILDDYLAFLVRDENIEVTFTLGVRYRAFTLNCERFPTNITAFRRAMAFGFDKYRANVECIGGVGVPLDSYIPLIATEWEVESDLPTYFYEADFVSGNTSLENAGFKDVDGDGWREYVGSGTTIIYDDNDPAIVMDMYATAGYDPAIVACEIMQDGLAAMGVRSNVVEMDFDQIFDNLFAGDCWVACWTEGVSVVNTVKVLYDHFRTGAQWNKDPNNYYHFSNATIDAVLDDMVNTTDVAVIKEKAREASLMLAFEQPQIVVYNDAIVGAYRNDKFKGFFEANGLGYTHGDNWAAATKVMKLDGTLGGTFKYCLSDNMNTWNPYLQKTGYEATVFQYIYEKLWNADPFTWDPIPGLAYDWDITPTTAGTDGWMQDGQKFTFYLYENETWHDGEAFTAADVNNSIYMWRDSPYHPTEMWDIYNVTMPNGPDGHQIEIYVNQTGFFEFADTTGFYITPEHIWASIENISGYTPEPADETVIGTGPYKVVPDGWVAGEYINLVRHEDWRWDIRDTLIEPTTTSEEPSQATVTITVPASCPSPETIVVTDEVTKTVVKTIYPEDTSETTEASEETGESPNITPGFEISVLTTSMVLGVLLIYKKRRRR